MELEKSETFQNLMRAFAGESQARNRYTFAAQIAKNEGYAIIEGVFKYTANQEKAHAEQFFKLLKNSKIDNVNISANYPIDLKDNILDLLKSAEHNEKEEAENIYVQFSNIAKNEGFQREAYVFKEIAKIEKIHSERFGKIVKDMENGCMFNKPNEITWICSNCGYICTSKEAPKMCPVCEYSQKYFMPFLEAFESIECK